MRSAAYRELGDQFEASEHARFGEQGFENMVADVARHERTLSIAALGRFAPLTPAVAVGPVCYPHTIIAEGVVMQSTAPMVESARDVVRGLIGIGGRLTDEVAEPIARQGREAIPALIEILEDEALAQSDAPGGGFAPIHAAKLLADLEAVEAIEPMLRVLARCDSMDILYSALIHALHRLGPPVLEPGLVAYAAATSSGQRSAFADVLARISVRDKRVFSILLEVLEDDVLLGACFLADYGDARALPHLSDALDDCELDPNGGLLSNQEVIEIEGAIAELGGELTAEQAHRVETVRARHDAARAPLMPLFDAGRRLDAARIQDSAALSKERDDHKRKKRTRKLKKLSQRRNRS